MQVRYECKLHGRIEFNTHGDFGADACCEMAKQIETISHDDASAICTGPGWAAYRNARREELRSKRGQAIMREMFPPLVFVNNMASGRLATTSKADLDRMK